MEPEPTLVPAEPVHEPEFFRGVMRQKLLANLAAVGGLADLGDFAHKLQPDLVPADVTASEDTVEAPEGSDGTTYLSTSVESPTPEQESSDWMSKTLLGIVGAVLW